VNKRRPPVRREHLLESERFFVHLRLLQRAAQQAVSTGNLPVPVEPEMTRQQFREERTADEALLKRIRRGETVVPGPMDLMSAKQRKFGAWVVRRLGRAMREWDIYFINKLLRAMRTGLKAARRQAENRLILRLSGLGMPARKIKEEVRKQTGFTLEENTIRKRRQRLREKRK
jgi:hypothetical protein